VAPGSGPFQSIDRFFKLITPITTTKGNQTGLELSPELRITAIRGTRVAWEYETSYELFGGIGFRQHAHEAEFETDGSAGLQSRRLFSIGDGINYRPAEGLSLSRDERSRQAPP